MKSKTILAIAYLASIVAANYAIQHIGTPPPFPGGPHTLPVWPGVDAPSGVYVVGLTLVLRDVVQRQSGKAITFTLILAATGLTFLIAPSLAVASGLAFLASETVDFAVFSLVEKRSYLGAVLASNAVSILVDSILFLTIAFGSLAFLQGQLIGKAFGTLAGFTILAALELRRRNRREVVAA